MAFRRRLCSPATWRLRVQLVLHPFAHPVRVIVGADWQTEVIR